MQDPRALDAVRTIPVRQVPFTQPLTWLARGWRDLCACPVPGLLHGLAAALIMGFVGQPLPTPADFFRVVVLGKEGHLFEAWLLLGGLMAAPMFASTVATIPLLLDRDLSVKAAVLTSVRAVMFNPAPMALWALLILALTLFGGLMLLAGLVVVVPWLAHASWHAYRDVLPDVR